MTTTTCWREHKNSFLGAVLLGFGTVLTVLRHFTVFLSCPSPPKPAGPNHLRYPFFFTEEGKDRGPVHDQTPYSSSLRRGESVYRVHGFADWCPPSTGGPTGERKVLSVGAARLPQIGGLSVGFISLKPLDCVSLCGV